MAKLPISLAPNLKSLNGVNSLAPLLSRHLCEAHN